MGTASWPAVEGNLASSGYASGSQSLREAQMCARGKFYSLVDSCIMLGKTGSALNVPFFSSSCNNQFRRQTSRGQRHQTSLEILIPRQTMTVFPLEQVPPGTVVYIPEERSTEGADDDAFQWLRNPGQPWVGALHYQSDEEGEGTAEEASSQAVQKRKLGREVADLRESGDQVLLARGGEGGRGNAFHSTEVRK